jgi:hypothetical protein
MYEDLILRKGHRLVYGGLSDITRRDQNTPRHWTGLTTADRVLLYAWLQTLDAGVDELHTDIVCGLTPELPSDYDYGLMQQLCAALHPLRMDAVIRRGVRWTIIECKPDAGYQALGQILSYAVYAPYARDALADADLLVVTDQIQAWAEPVYRRHNVAWANVGHVLDEQTQTVG